VVTAILPGIWLTFYEQVPANMIEVLIINNGKKRVPSLTLGLECVALHIKRITFFMQHSTQKTQVAMICGHCNPPRIWLTFHEQVLANMIEVLIINKGRKRVPSLTSGLECVALHIKRITIMQHSNQKTQVQRDR
jgi:hypothetical protein